MPTQSKNALQSLTIWGGLAAIVAGAIGIAADDAQQIGAHVDSLVAIIAGVMAIVGRFRARKTLTVKPGAAPVLLFLLAAAAAVVGTPGCQAVGPTRSQGAAGQTTANSPLNATTIKFGGSEGETWTSEHAGPGASIDMGADGFSAVKTGQVTRDIAWSDPDGRRFSLSAGSDFAAVGVEVFQGGAPLLKIAEFSTSSSEPVRALNEALDRYGAVWQSLSADQRAVIEAQVAAIEAAVPEVAGLLGKLLVPAP